MKIEEQVKAISDMSTHLPDLLGAYGQLSSHDGFVDSYVDKKLLGEMINKYISVLNGFCIQAYEHNVTKGDNHDNQ